MPDLYLFVLAVMPYKIDSKKGSSLLSVGGRDAEFSGGKVEHGDEVVG